jgi:hypothetical protein
MQLATSTHIIFCLCGKISVILVGMVVFCKRRGMPKFACLLRNDLSLFEIGGDDIVEYYSAPVIDHFF